LQPQVKIPRLGSTSAAVEPTPGVFTKNEEIHDSETSETHEAEGSKAHKADETICNIVRLIPPFFLLNNIYPLCSLSFTLLRIDEILDQLVRETSPDQAPNPDDQSVQQVMPCLILYFSKFTQ
jgi:hypothetical protein